MTTERMQMTIPKSDFDYDFLPILEDIVLFVSVILSIQKRVRIRIRYFSSQLLQFMLSMNIRQRPVLLFLLTEETLSLLASFRVGWQSWQEEEGEKIATTHS
jgi:hypothetical protein